MKILVFGGTFWDVFIYGNEPHKAEILEMPGGSGLNIAYGLFKQGFEVHFYSNVGSDWRGEEIKRILADDKFDISHIRAISDAKTGHHIAFNDKPIAVDRGANKERIEMPVVEEAEVCIINTEIPRETILDALKIPAKLTVVDLGPRPIISPEEIKNACDNELLILGTEIECNSGCHVTKLGSRGALVKDKLIPSDARIYPYKVGAGDAFDIVLITLYLRTRDILFSARSAVEASQKMVREVKGAFSKAKALKSLI
ncbi:hypothetical protein AT15_02255 [Kosmotoga arenicorallina S304]|uniref:Carbohydrate kinase PfkB domain-containing protein n=1 Tax=Kosmotoga arenicorallina S304 TaxID=1453497 RepID=A0A176JZA2_9BACT|nr:carbohydrate kinase family protein [Kosmotoga arenicorallina]OAA29363.1 hypothetical protein AT15_02255 [Kosmotoga arenicorallina S304]